jgi:hypothetical protein
MEGHILPWRGARGPFRCSLPPFSLSGHGGFNFQFGMRVVGGKFDADYVQALRASSRRLPAHPLPVSRTSPLALRR